MRKDEIIYLKQNGPYLEFEVNNVVYHYKNFQSEKDAQELEGKMFQGIMEAMKKYNETGNFADLGGSSVLENLIIAGTIAGIEALTPDKKFKP